MTTICNLDLAAEEYIGRSNGSIVPLGARDCRGVWFPSKLEKRVCCDWVTMPTEASPDGYLIHCCKLTHVAQLYGVMPEALYVRVRELEMWGEVWHGG